MIIVTIRITGVLDCTEFETMITSFLSEEQLSVKGLDACKLFMACLDETAALAKRSNMEV